MFRGRNEKDSIDTIVTNVLRYVACFGLTTHLYDAKRHRLVHSRSAHCYSVCLHVVFMAVILVFYFLAEVDEYKVSGDGYLAEKVLILLVGLNTLSILVTLVSQWTLRADVASLFSEIIEIWHKDMAHLKYSHKVRRQSGRLFLFKTLTLALIITISLLGIYQKADGSLSVAKNVLVFLLLNVIMAVMYLFCVSLMFSDYLFRILNHNLAGLVEDIRSQASRCGLRHEMHVLGEELNEIGRIHVKLQKWVVRFKDMYQLDLLLIMMLFFVLQVFMLFFLCVCIHMKPVGEILWNFIAASSFTFLRTLDLVWLFYTCRQLLNASHEGAHIMRDLTTHGSYSVQLERCVERMCLQFKCERLRLRICGLVDLDWSKVFTMTELALLYILLLIQIDYEDFWN